MSLVINLATRGRPDLLLDTVSRTLPNIARPDTVFMLSIDADDQPTIDALHRLPSDERLLPLVMEREDTVGAKWNRALVHRADAYMIMVDYAPNLTPGFDQKIVEAVELFPDNIGVVYSHLANASFPTLNVVTRGLVEKMGFIYPEYFPYWFVDHWLDDIARMIGRIAFVDVKVDCSKRPGTQEMREPRLWASLFDVLILDRRASALDIIDSAEFEEPAWRKAMLRGAIPLVEQRSTWVNSHVKQMPSTAAGDGGPRYARLRERALAIIAAKFPEIEALSLAA